MYKLQDGTFQKKTALIRLLQIDDSNEMAGEAKQSSPKRMAKIVSEVQIDLAQHVGQGDLQVVYPFKTPLISVKTSISTVIHVR